MRAVKWGVLALFVVVFASGLSSLAVAQTIGESEFDEPAADGFEPETRNPLGEADLGGDPPYTTYDFGASGTFQDWNDIRNGWVGVIEENMSPVGDDPTYPGPDPGSPGLTEVHGPHPGTLPYAVVQHEGGTGPFWSATSFNDNFTKLSYNVDVWADPVVPALLDGLPDFWWTNAVAATGGSYITESGIAPTVNPGGTWTFSTTSGVPIATVAVGSWYEMEVSFVQGADGDLDAIHTLYDPTGTIPLGSVTLTSLFLTPVNQTMGPSYSWFTFFTPNMDVIFIDDFRVEGVPEPSTIAMFGVGAVGMIVVARRRRRS